MSVSAFFREGKSSVEGSSFPDPSFSSFLILVPYAVDGRDMFRDAGLTAAARGTYDGGAGIHAAPQRVRDNSLASFIHICRRFVKL